MKPAMTRRLDREGRIIIPAEIRQTMNLATGDILEICPVKQGIYLTKYKEVPISHSSIKKYLDTLYSTTRCSAAICTTEHILAAKGIPLEDAAVCKTLAAFIMDQQKISFVEPVYVTDSIHVPVDTLFPMSKTDSLYPPMALLLFKNIRSGQNCVTDEDRLCASVIASLFISQNL